MYDLALDASSHDLVLTGKNDLLVIDHAERVAQQIKINLKLIKGEWFLAPEAGVPYLEEVFVKNPSPEHIKSLYRSKILEVQGVEAVESLELVEDARLRSAAVSFTARTPYGVVAGREVLGYGK